MSQLESLLEETEGIARAAGDVLQSFVGRLERIEFKGDVNLVTAADRAAEKLIVDRLTTLTPNASILAEEGSGVHRDEDHRWIVDPLDGTTNFAHGYPAYCVSIAYEQRGRMELGIVHDPTRNETFSAIRGRGSRLNGEPIHVTRAATIGEALLVTGFPYDVRESPRDNLIHFAAFAKRARGIRRDGSAALNLSYVAAGRLDGFWEEKLSPWDVAAGCLLVEEAGGVVTDYHGTSPVLSDGHVVAAPPDLHRDMLALIHSVEERSELPPVGPRQP